MAILVQHFTFVLRSTLRWPAFAMVLLCALTMIVTQPAQAQAFTVIHNFTGGQDGAFPETGLTRDAAGNLYGTTEAGGQVQGGNCPGRGCGVVFKMAKRGDSWVLTPVYTFQDGDLPSSSIAIAPDGVLYGTTLYGGFNDDGASYQLKPPAVTPRSVLSPWTETVLYSFGRGGNGFNPQGDLTFDQSGNIYGTTQVGGVDFNGVVYELTAAGGGWTQSVLYSPSGGVGNEQFDGGVVFDSSGNLYGVTPNGGQYGLGGVFELSPSGSGWTGQTIYSFSTGSMDGRYPVGGLLIDSSGNIYGTTTSGGSGGGGTVFELTPGGGGWTFKLLYGLSGASMSGPQGRLIMDVAGNVYGVTYGGGAHRFGSVFKLTTSGGSWIYSSLHDFTGAAKDGAFPVCGPIMDANGNVYGTVSAAGAYDKGNVWEIAP